MFKKRKRGGAKNIRKRVEGTEVVGDGVALKKEGTEVLEDEPLTQLKVSKKTTQGSIIYSSSGQKKKFKLSLDTDAKVFEEHNKEQKRVEDAAAEAAAMSRGSRRALERKKKEQQLKESHARTTANIRTNTVVDFQQAVCKDFKETGYCGFGDTCIYLHDRSQNLPTEVVGRTKEWEVKSKKLSMGGFRRNPKGPNVAERFLSSKKKDYAAQVDSAQQASRVAKTQRYCSVLKSDGY